MGFCENIFFNNFSAELEYTHLLVINKTIIWKINQIMSIRCINARTHLLKMLSIRILLLYLFYLKIGSLNKIQQNSHLKCFLPKNPGQIIHHMETVLLSLKFRKVAQRLYNFSWHDYSHWIVSWYVRMGDELLHIFMCYFKHFFKKGR